MQAAVINRAGWPLGSSRPLDRSLPMVHNGSTPQSYRTTASTFGKRGVDDVAGIRSTPGPGCRGGPAGVCQAGLAGDRASPYRQDHVCAEDRVDVGARARRGFLHRGNARSRRARGLPHRHAGRKAGNTRQHSFSQSGAGRQVQRGSAGTRQRCAAVLQATETARVVVIDEIGKMELESLAFQATWRAAGVLLCASCFSPPS